MNREILFRGKRIDNGEWAYSQTVFSHLDNFYIPTQNLKCTVMRNLDTVGNISEIRCKDGKCFFKVHPETVGQFTGLTDKNGKKIFEWDIVKTKFGRICKVIFFQSPCYCGIDLIPLEDKHKCPDKFDLYLSDNLEIIGNIHDNPDLTEVNK